MTVRRRPLWLTLLTLLFALSLFVWLIARTGFHNIATEISRLGVGFLWVLLISGARQALRTAAWYCAIDPGVRNVRLLELFAMRIAGEAVTDLTFLGPLLGETVKGIVLARKITPVFSASSLIIENFMYNGTVLLLICSGLGIFVVMLSPPPAIRAAMIGLFAVVLLLLLLGCWAATAKSDALRTIVDRLLERKAGWERIKRQRRNFQRIELNLSGFARSHTAALGLIFFFEALAVLTGVIETSVILSATTGRSSLKTAYLAEAVNRAVNFAFAFVPLRVGVEEGGAAVALANVGYRAADGVVLALVRKIRSLIWIALGMGPAAYYSLTSHPKDPG